VIAFLEKFTLRKQDLFEVFPEVWLVGGYFMMKAVAKDGSQVAHLYYKILNIFIQHDKLNPNLTKSSYLHHNSKKNS